MATKDTEITDIAPPSATDSAALGGATSFQESILRLVLKAFALVTLGLLLFLALTNRQAAFPQIVLCVVVLALAHTASFLLSRHQNTIATRLTIVSFLVAAAGSILLPLIPGDFSLGLGLFLLTLIVATVILPLTEILPAALLVGVVLVAALSLAARDFTLNHILLDVILLGGTALLLHQVRAEFDNRLTALDGAKREIESANQAKEEADNFKYQVIGGISHDLRSPLNAVIGYAEIMLSGMTGALSDKQLELINYMHINAQKLLGLINDVLNLKSVQVNAVEAILGQNSPTNIVTPVVEKLKASAAAKQIALNLTIAPDAPQIVTTDAQLTQDVVRYLIENAIKFTTEGAIDVSVGSATDNRWYIKVTDSGSGIPQDHLEDIFMLFQRLENAKGKKGIGLGLTVVKGFVNQLRGEIVVESQVDKGSTFTVYLPNKQR